MSDGHTFLDHVKCYAGAYLVGAIFIFVTLLQSYVAQFAKFENFTNEQLAGVTMMQWRFSWANMLIQAGITILAFLNQSLARANKKKDDATADKKAGTSPPYAPSVR